MKCLIILLALLVLCSSAGSATVERYVDEDGVIHMRRSDPPPPSGASVTVIKKNDTRRNIAGEGDSADNKCVVNKLYVKELSFSYGYVEVSFKADVQNYGVAGSCFVEIQGLDGDGYQILSNHLIDNIDLNGVRSFSGQRTYADAQYSAVKEWKVKSSTKGRLKK